MDRNGITLLGDQNTVIVGNQILSQASTERCTNGIQVGSLSGNNEEINLTLSGNTITGNEYLDYDSIWYSAGILLTTCGNVTAGDTTLAAGVQANATAVFELIMNNNTLSDNDVSCWIFNPATGAQWQMEFGGKRYYIGQLANLVVNCEAKINSSEEVSEGAYHAKYPTGSIAAFQEVIEVAKEILNNKDNYTAEQVEAAYNNLSAAKTTFEDSVYVQYLPSSVSIAPAILFAGERATIEIELPNVTGEWVALLVEMDGVEPSWHCIQDGGPNDQDGATDSSILFEIASEDYPVPGEYTITVYAANYEVTDQTQLDLARFNKKTSVVIEEGLRPEVIYVGSEPEPGKTLYESITDAVEAIKDGGTIYVQAGEHSIPATMFSIEKNLTIRGLGANPVDTVLKQSARVTNKYIFNVVAGKSFSIYNLTIDGNGLASNGVINAAGNLTAQDVVFQNSADSTSRGIRLQGEYAFVDNCQLSGIKNSGISAYGIWISNGFSGAAIISNCSVTGSARGICIDRSDADVMLIIT